MVSLVLIHSPPFTEQPTDQSPLSSPLQPARHTKLEKADILEMTVKHLQNIQRQQLILNAQTDSTILQFKSGFVDCADEVTRYIGQMDGLDLGVRQRLANHLNGCVSNIQRQININTGSGFGHFVQQQNSSASPFPLLADLNNNNTSSAVMNGRVGGIQVNGVQLVPSRLPSGEIALIMPNSNNVSLNSLLAVNSPTPSFNPIVKSTPNGNSHTGLLVPSSGGNYMSSTTAYPRMSAFNPISSVKSRQYSSNLSSSPSLHANNSPPLSPVSSISSSDLDSHPSMEPFNLLGNNHNNNNNSTVVTTTPPLSSSGAANSSSSLNISSPQDVSMSGAHARHLQQSQVSSTTQQQCDRMMLPKKRTFAMMEATFDQRSLCSTASDTTNEDHQQPSEKMPKMDGDECAKDDMWRPW